VGAIAFIRHSDDRRREFDETLREWIGWQNRRTVTGRAALMTDWRSGRLTVIVAPGWDRRYRSVRWQKHQTARKRSRAQQKGCNRF
jgi:hypothetical protein